MSMNKEIMATTIEHPAENKVEPELLGLLAEFNDPESLMEASRKVRDAGYNRWDTHTPFPVHGIDEAMGIKYTILPWIVAACGLTGGTIAISMQYWMNAVDYPFLISGKPLFSIPACIPIMFELSVLLAAFGAFFGMLGLNQLPKLYNPIFKSDAFRRATNDRFFLSMDASDPKFSEIDTGEFVKSLNPNHVEEFWSDVESPKLPRNLKLGLSLFGVLMLMPIALVAYKRSTVTDNPRIHIIPDMDFQPKLKTQNTTNIFGDGREMRPHIPGTIPRGQYKDDNIPFYYGLKVLPEDQDVITIAAQDEASRVEDSGGRPGLILGHEAGEGGGGGSLDEADPGATAGDEGERDDAATGQMHLVLMACEVVGQEGDRAQGDGGQHVARHPLARLVPDPRGVGPHPAPLDPGAQVFSQGDR